MTNSILLVGDSRLNLQHIAQAITDNSTSKDGKYTYHIENKYYNADAEIIILTERDIMSILSDPIRRQEYYIPLLNNINALIVAFDASDDGFSLIQKLYTSHFDSLLNNSDVRIFLGCTPSYNTITRPTFRTYQDFALDNTMQLIFYTHPNVSSIDYSSLIIPDDVNHDNITSEQVEPNYTDNDNDSDDDDDNDFQLDNEDIGVNSIHIALSCCTWPVMTRAIPSTANQPTFTRLVQQDRGIETIDDSSEDNDDDDDDDDDNNNTTNHDNNDDDDNDDDNNDDINDQVKTLLSRLIDEDSSLYVDLSDLSILDDRLVSSITTIRTVDDALSPNTTATTTTAHAAMAVEDNISFDSSTATAVTLTDNIIDSTLDNSTDNIPHDAMNQSNTSNTDSVSNNLLDTQTMTSSTQKTTPTTSVNETIKKPTAPTSSATKSTTATTKKSTATATTKKSTKKSTTKSATLTKNTKQNTKTNKSTSISDLDNQLRTFESLLSSAQMIRSQHDKLGNNNDQQRRENAASFAMMLASLMGDIDDDDDDGDSMFNINDDDNNSIYSMNLDDMSIDDIIKRHDNQ